MNGEAAEPRVERGVAHLLYAYDAGQLIDLDESERRINTSTARASIKQKRRAPKYFRYQPAPLHVIQAADARQIGNRPLAAHVDVVLFDFGAVSVTYSVPLRGSLAELAELSAALYDDVTLLADSRQRVADLLALLGSAVARPHLAPVTESYTVFWLQELSGMQASEELALSHAQDLAQILRGERQRLSAQEVRDATASRIAFGTADLTVIDSDAAIVLGDDADDILVVLEFATVELLEMRCLDSRLDGALDQAYRVLARLGWRHVLRPGAARSDLQRVAQLQVDSALLFEGVNNAFKLIGDQFLARVYRLASGRFHLAEWDASILRKLETLDGIYSKFAELASNRRMEVLEWIIILLIAFEIVLSLTRG